MDAIERGGIILRPSSLHIEQPKDYQSWMKQQVKDKTTVLYFLQLTLDHSFSQSSLSEAKTLPVVPKP